MLKVEDLRAEYGRIPVLRGVSFEVREGEAVALLGRNGVGKTTTLKAVMGLKKANAGRVEFDGRRLDALPPHLVPREGIGYVPQGRGIFPNLTVFENLCIGLPRDPLEDALTPIFSRFPYLKERRDQLGGTLSGGEQQMLAIARCLVMNPRIILLDEPTEGIMPILVAQIRRQIASINRSGVSILLVEQNIHTALKLCSRVYIMEKGAVCYEGRSDDLRNNPAIIHRYLGVSV